MLKPGSQIGNNYMSVLMNDLVNVVIPNMTIGLSAIDNIGREAQRLDIFRVLIPE